MPDPLRPSPLSPALRRLAARAGAALVPGARRDARAEGAADHVVIEGTAEPVGPSVSGAGITGAAAYRAAAGRRDRAEDAVPPEAAGDDRGTGGFRLVAAPVDLRNGEMVERFLPDILGRALARGWVDAEFRGRLVEDPKTLLLDHGVHLPGSIWIETQTGPNQRPMIVVHERQPDGRLRRLLYLQLVMLAGK